MTGVNRESGVDQNNALRAVNDPEEVVQILPGIRLIVQMVVQKNARAIRRQRAVPDNEDPRVRIGRTTELIAHLAVPGCRLPRPDPYARPSEAGKSPPTAAGVPRPAEK